MGCRLRYFFPIFLIATAAVAANDRDTCSERKGDKAIAACTRLISSGRLEVADQATIYVLRGIAYRHKAAYDQAIADFTQAIELAQKLASNDLVAAAFGVRASAYSLKGDLDKALADYRSALTANPNNEQAAEGIKRIQTALASPHPPGPQIPAATAPPPGVPREEEVAPKTKREEKPKRRSTALVRESPASDARGLLPGSLRQEPGPGAVRKGYSLLVDDGSCPKGQVKQIIGGSLKYGIPRGRRCVARNQQTQ